MLIIIGERGIDRAWPRARVGFEFRDDGVGLLEVAGEGPLRFRRPPCSIAHTPTSVADITEPQGRRPLSADVEP